MLCRVLLVLFWSTQRMPKYRLVLAYRRLYVMHHDWLPVETIVTCLERRRFFLSCVSCAKADPPVANNTIATCEGVFAKTDFACESNALCACSFLFVIVALLSGNRQTQGEDY